MGSAVSFAQEKNSEITCEPSLENRRIVGFTCPFLHPESLLYKMGIQPEDQIVEYDGVSITSFQEMQNFYEQLHRRNIVRVKFKRGGHVFSAENINLQTK